MQHFAVSRNCAAACSDRSSPVTQVYNLQHYRKPAGATKRFGLHRCVQSASVPQLINGSPIAIRRKRRSVAKLCSFNFSSNISSGSSKASADYAIETSNLTATLGDRQVLRGTDLAVRRGDFHILLGPNGCGKSTLLRVLAGLLKPAGGCFRVDRPAGMVFQNPDHQVVMPTVGADVAFGLGRYKLTEAQVRGTVHAALKQVGMAEFHDMQMHTLSGGQKQRVAIAGALAEAPKVLLLDELTTFVDNEDQLLVLNAVRSAVGASSGITALWVTHRLEELRFAHSASYMEDGVIKESSSADGIIAYMRRLGAPV